MNLAVEVHMGRGKEWGRDASMHIENVEAVEFQRLAGEGDRRIRILHRDAAGALHADDVSAATVIVASVPASESANETGDVTLVLDRRGAVATLVDSVLLIAPSEGHVERRPPEPTQEGMFRWGPEPRRHAAVPAWP